VLVFFFFFFVATAQFGQGHHIVEVSGSHTMKHTHTHTHTNTPVHRAGLPCTNDQLDAEYSTYITHNKHETPIPSAIFEPALPAFERPQTFVLICTVAGIGVCHTHSSFNCLSYDRSKASSKTSCRHTAI